jgi:hypothetical protein
MAKLVDLDNAAYATFVALSSEGANPPSRATQFHAPPSFLNNYHQEDHEQISKTWSEVKERRKTTTVQSERRAEDVAMFTAVGGDEELRNRAEVARQRKERMVKTSIDLGYDYQNGEVEVERVKQRMPDHSNQVWLNDQRKLMQKKFGNGKTAQQNLMANLRKSSISFGLDGVNDRGYDDDLQNAERWRSSARDGMVLKGVDKDVRKHAEAARRKKIELQSHSKGMSLGLDKVVYETDQENGLRATMRAKSMQSEDPRGRIKDKASHLVDSMTSLLQQSSDYE